MSMVRHPAAAWRDDTVGAYPRRCAVRRSCTIFGPGRIVGSLLGTLSA